MHSEKNRSGQRFRNPVIEYALLLASLSGVFYFLFGNTFQAQFALIDDHQILSFSTMPEIPIWKIAVSNDIQSAGRFRPVDYLFRLAEVALFGANPRVWHIAATGFGVLTCFLLYIAMRKTGGDILSSLLFILPFTVTGSQNLIWCKLGLAETLGMLLTSTAVWAIVNAAHQGKPGFWDGLALVAMALAGLTKESFVLIIPALLLLRWTLQCWFNKETRPQAWHTLRTPLVGGLLVFIVEILIVVAVLLYKPEGYGAGVAGLSLKSFDPRGWYRLLTSSELAAVARYLPFSCALILAIHWPKKKLACPYIFAGLLIVMAWVIPQLVLYSDGIGGHYLFPVIVGIAAVNALGLAVLWQRRIWILWAVCAIWLSPSLSNGLSTTTQETSAYTANTLAVHEMVTHLAKNVEANHTILIVADPAFYYETIYSLRVHLRFAGSKSPAYLFPVLPEQGYTNEKSQRLAEGMIAQYPDLETLDPNHIGGIIVLTSPAEDDTPSWFNLLQWQEMIFDEPYYRFSLQELKYVKVGEVSYRILASSEPLVEVPTNYPLIFISSSLKGRVSIDWRVKTAWWGMEKLDGYSQLWLGHGEAEGLADALWSAEKQLVILAFDVLPGPSREDSLRTVELTLDNEAGTQTERQQFDQATTLAFGIELQPGPNEFIFKSLDRATVLMQPNGDSRPLLVLLHHITVASLTGGSQAGPENYPLITVDPSLAGAVGIDPQLKMPWPIEVYEDHSLSFLWLGHGEAEGVAGVLWSDADRPVVLEFEVSPGPSREDQQRTVQLVIQSNGGQATTQKETFDGPVALAFPVQLQPGRNDFQFTVLDEATIPVHGDTRPLLVFLRHITVKPLPGS